MDSLPVFLRLTGRRVLIVGDGDAADAKARLVAAAGGEVVGSLPAVLAFVALDDADAAAREARRLRAAGLLVNVVDRPALCDFTVPAIVDRSPVIVAIGTGGASASLAKALRARMEVFLPAGLGRLARAIRDARPMVAARAATIADRRRLWDAALAPGGALDPLHDHDDSASVINALDVPAERDAVVEVRLVSDDPDDLTVGQLRTLAQADTIVAQASVPAAIFAQVRRDAVRLEALPAPPLPGRTAVIKPVRTP